MKQCPVCQTTYTDDSLQFCLEDGATLSFSATSPTEQPTQQFPAKTNPIRVNISQDSFPTIVDHPKIVEPEPKKKEGSGYNLIIGLVGGFIISAILAAGLFVLILKWQNSGKSEIIANQTPTQTPTVNQTPDETANLKEKVANLEKKMQEQKNQKQNVPNVPIISNTNSTANSTTTKVTARVNSPSDGFLALRAAPDAETGAMILKIPQGSTVTVLSCLPKAPGKKGRWCRVDYNGNLGWAFDGLLIY